MYIVCMSRVNVTIPDQVIDAARERGINVSAIAAAALEAELARLDSVERMRADLDELDVEVGSVSPEEAVAAADWVTSMTSQRRAGSAP